MADLDARLYVHLLFSVCYTCRLLALSRQAGCFVRAADILEVPRNQHFRHCESVCLKHVERGCYLQRHVDDTACMLTIPYHLCSHKGIANVLGPLSAVPSLKPCATARRLICFSTILLCWSANSFKSGVSTEYAMPPGGSGKPFKFYKCVENYRRRKMRRTETVKG